MLDRIAAWIRRYLYLPHESADAIALWAAATWCVDQCYFAPILAVLSATKQCGKSLVLDLLRSVARRPELTSGTGVTIPVIFRQNEIDRPTFLIDEAERLGGSQADRELIGMLNAGYRRGGRVKRCVEARGDYVVRSFDAFGFRAVAAIGTLRDTILDRSVVIRLARKPPHARVDRFSGRCVAREGHRLARQLRRWTDDHLERFAEIEEEVVRPSWLSDRACDNWTALFTVATLAGGEWPARADRAAQHIQCDGNDGDGDRFERLLHDVRNVFELRHWPEAVRSGDLAIALNKIETSPWGDERSGKGLSPHALANGLKPFGIVPAKRRTRDGQEIRGYWLSDLAPVLDAYPVPQRQLSHDNEVSQRSTSVSTTSKRRTAETLSERHSTSLAEPSPNGGRRS